MNPNEPQWSVTLATPQGIRVHGADLLEITREGDVLHAAVEIPAGCRLTEATCKIPRALRPGERIFMNGYQSWTACREYGPRDRIPPIRLPRFVQDRHGLDRYGDSRFIPYPNRPGVTHGFSWCYFRLGASYHLAASLTERNGFTTFTYDAKKGLLTISKELQGLEATGRYSLFDLYFAQGTEDRVFDGWFAAMGITPRTAEPLAGYCSWYRRYQAIFQETILEDLEAMDRLPGGPVLFQVDDGWEPAIGDWLEADPKKFPEGMGHMARRIHEKGYRAGLWLAPFVCQQASGLFQAHPDWCLTDEAGQPYCCGSNWGGFYALDWEKPEVQAYLRQVFRRVLEEWGYDFVKLDFLYAACVLPARGQTRGERMCKAMEFLRELVGNKQILACGVPLMPAFGLVDYCRIGPDVGLDWDDKPHMRLAHRERVSTKQSLLNTLFRRQLDGRAFGNDPDVFFLREDHLAMTETEKGVLAQLNCLFGSLRLTSDNAGGYTPQMLERYQALLNLRKEADQVQVACFDREVTVTYRLRGKLHRLTIRL